MNEKYDKWIYFAIGLILGFALAVYNIYIGY